MTTAALKSTEATEPNTTDIRAACRGPTGVIVARLVKEVTEGGPDWLAASKLLLAYGWGRPSERLEVVSEGGGRPLEGLTSEQILAALRGERP